MATVNNLYQYNLIDNYIYFYHLNTYMIIPTYMETVADTSSANWSEQSILSRTAPIFSYSNSGPRSMSFNLSLHRDLMQQVNLDSNSTALQVFIDKMTAGMKPQDKQAYIQQFKEDYLDIFIKYMQAAVLPVYDAASKMVNPPIVAVRMGKDIFIKGIIKGSVITTYGGVIDRNDKYSKVDVQFQVTETTPYTADLVLRTGSNRTLNETLERSLNEAI